MCAYLIVVFHVRQQYVTKMSLAQDDDMIDAFPADRTDQPFSISVLPWGARRRWSITNAHCPRTYSAGRLTIPSNRDPSNKGRFAIHYFAINCTHYLDLMRMLERLEICRTSSGLHGTSQRKENPLVDRSFFNPITNIEHHANTIGRIGRVAHMYVTKRYRNVLG
jgi:hypothetical protein